jgi:hypothetical protein
VLFVGLGAVIGVVLGLAVGTGFAIINRGRAAMGEASLAPPLLGAGATIAPTPTAVPPNAAPLEGVLAEAVLAPGTDYTFVVDEVMVNQWVAAYAQDNAMPAEDIQIAFETGQIVATGLYSGVLFQLTGTPQVENGEITFSVTSLDAAGFPLPPEVGDSVGAMIAESLDALTAEMAGYATIEAISVEQDRMVLTGQEYVGP